MTEALEKMVEVGETEAIKKKIDDSRQAELAWKLGLSKMRSLLTSPDTSIRYAAVRTLNSLNPISSNDYRFWSIHRIGTVCKLHLLIKRYKPGDHIIGILDFSGSDQTCAKYSIIWQCEEAQKYQIKEEFSYGLKKNEFMIPIPDNMDLNSPILHCVLSFLFYIVDKRAENGETVIKFEDKVGTVELAPSQLETKLFGCDFPLAIYNSNNSSRKHSESSNMSISSNNKDNINK